MKLKEMWKQLIENLETNAKFQPPYNGGFQEAEQTLGAALPDELKALLRECNGVHDEWGTGLIWPLELIVDINSDMRSHADYRNWHMPFDALLFFADSGGGDQFACSMVKDMLRYSRIFIWKHEDDSRLRVAPSLQIYLEWQISGKIRL